MWRYVDRYTSFLDHSKDRPRDKILSCAKLGEERREEGAGGASSSLVFQMTKLDKAMFKML